MLKKRERLSRNEFKNLLEKGRRRHERCFTLLSLQNKHDFKCGIVVGKKIAKHATKRNTLRRKIYAILEKNRATLQATHTAVLTKPCIVDLTTDELENTLTEALQTCNSKTRPSKVK